MHWMLAFQFEEEGKTSWRKKRMERKGRKTGSHLASGCTSEIQQSLMRMRRVRKGNCETDEGPGGGKTSAPKGRLGKIR